MPALRLSRRRPSATLFAPKGPSLLCSQYAFLFVPGTIFIEKPVDGKIFIARQVVAEGDVQRLDKILAVGTIRRHLVKIRQDGGFFLFGGLVSRHQLALHDIVVNTEIGGYLPQVADIAVHVAHGIQVRHLVSVLPDEIGVGMLQIDLQVLRGPPVQLALLKAVHSQVAEHRFVAVVNPAIQKQRSVVLILGKGQRIAGVDIHMFLMIW